MTQPTHLIGDTYCLEVPSMAYGFDINNYGNGSELMYMLSMEDISDEPNSKETLITKKLPPGNWQLICTINEATEEQAKRIVEEFIIRGHIRYTDYTRGFMWQETALDSLRSLLTSKGLDGNYVLIKKD